MRKGNSLRAALNPSSPSTPSTTPYVVSLGVVQHLRALLAEHLARPSASITAGQATYDLRRLREHGLIARLPHTHRYQVTDTGLTHAMFLTHAHDRFVRAGLAHLHDHHQHQPLRAATRAYQAALDTLAQQAATAA